MADATIIASYVFRCPFYAHCRLLVVNTIISLSVYLPFDGRGELLEHPESFRDADRLVSQGETVGSAELGAEFFFLHKFGEAGIRRRGTWRSSMAEAIDEARNQAGRMQHSGEGWGMGMEKMKKEK